MRSQMDSLAGARDDPGPHQEVAEVAQDAPAVNRVADPSPRQDDGDVSGGRRPSWLTSAGRAVAGTSRAGRYLGQTLRMMVGVPDYPAYVAHMRQRHPDAEPMSYEQFFRDRLDARYDPRRRPGGCC